MPNSQTACFLDDEHQGLASRDYSRWDVKVKLCFVDLECLRVLESLPRCGCASDFRHPVTGEPNSNICREYNTFDRVSTCFIFISHRWCQPGCGHEGHPDNESNEKLRLIVAACDALKGVSIPEGFGVACWMDFMCINQDGCPSYNFLKLLDGVMNVCDALLTPVVDVGHQSWSLPAQWDDCFAEYQAAEWKNYWSRSWCRLEALLAAVLPLEGDPVERASQFPNGALRNALAAGHRPHIVYGSKELEEKRGPLFLPPLLSTHLSRYPPLEGRMNPAEDPTFINHINNHALQCAEGKRVSSGYEGDTDEQGNPHGRGKLTWPSEKVYEGEFRNGKPHGTGRCNYPFWDIYDGEWQAGKRHGFGVHCYANGDVYEGEWQGNKRHGNGRFLRADGRVEEGRFEHGAHQCS